jgi:beta-lactamase class A
MTYQNIEISNIERQVVTMSKLSIEEALSALAGELPGKVGYYVKDLDNGRVIARNEDAVFNPASTIKILLLCAAFDSARKGRFSLNERVAVDDAVKVGGCGVLSELMAGLNPTVGDLMKLMVILSDNTATNMLFDIVGGAEALDLYAQSWKLRESRLRRKMFDTEAAARGINNTATPFELALVLEGLANKTLMHPDDCEAAIAMLLRQQVNTKIPGKIVDRWEWYSGTNPVKVAHKTGEVEGVEHDIGIMYLPNRKKVVLAVMTEGNDNEKAIDFIRNLAGELVARLAPGI